MSEKAFVLQRGSLLDARRVPGLAEALAADDAHAVLAAVCRACRPPNAVAGAGAVSRAKRRLADDALANRFTFYGETWALPDDINWDRNPGTAHWGHDLNRFSYLDALTQTYLTTGEARYSRKAVALVLDWIAKCDLGRCFPGTPYVFGSYLKKLAPVKRVICIVHDIDWGSA